MLEPNKVMSFLPGGAMHVICRIKAAISNPNSPYVK
jgi:hypothetical protein